MAHTVNPDSIEDYGIELKRKLNQLLSLCENLKENAQDLKTNINDLMNINGKRSTYGLPGNVNDFIKYGYINEYTKDLDDETQTAYNVELRVWDFQEISTHDISSMIRFTKRMIKILNKILVEQATGLEQTAEELTAEQLKILGTLSQAGTIDVGSILVDNTDAKTRGAEDEYSAASESKDDDSGIIYDELYRGMKFRFEQDAVTGSVLIIKILEDGTEVPMKWIPKETAEQLVVKVNEKQKELEQQAQQKNSDIPEGEPKDIREEMASWKKYNNKKTNIWLRLEEKLNITKEQQSQFNYEDKDGIVTITPKDGKNDFGFNEIKVELGGKMTITENAGSNNYGREKTIYNEDGSIEKYYNGDFQTGIIYQKETQIKNGPTVRLKQYENDGEITYKYFKLNENGVEVELKNKEAYNNCFNNE